MSWSILDLLVPLYALSGGGCKEPNHAQRHCLWRIVGVSPVSMTMTHDSLDPVLSLIPSDMPQAEAFAAFIHAFYHHKRVETFDEEPRVTYARVKHAWEFFSAPREEVSKTRVFVPEKQPKAWQTHRTVLQTMNTDMPFLLDSIAAEVARQGFEALLVFHPVIQVVRDEQGRVSAIGEEHGATQGESFIHFELSALPDHIPEEDLEKDVSKVLEAIRAVVADWQTCLVKLEESRHSLEEAGQHHREDIEEVKRFLEWLQGEHFIFLGTVDYRFRDCDGNDCLQVVEDSETGIFRLPDFELKPQGLQALPPEAIAFIHKPTLVDITKSTHKSVVHRPVHMDYIDLKQFDESGEVIGERRFLGLFTSLVYYQSAMRIPLVRRKIEWVIENAGFSEGGHNSKTLRTIMEFFPRDELFQTDKEQLLETAIGILELEERPQVGVFVRRDAFERFVSCLVFVPRENFSTTTRETIQQLLEQSFSGTSVAYYTQMTDSPLVRLHVIIRTQPGSIPDVDLENLQRIIAKQVMFWEDDFHQELMHHYGEKHAERMFRFYRHAFPKTYSSTYKPVVAVRDVAQIDQALRTNMLGLGMYPDQGGSSEFHLKIYNPNKQIPLSDIVPMLENLGVRILDETPFYVVPKHASGVWIRDFRLEPVGGYKPELHEVRERFETALARVWDGELESDAFNRLVLLAGLHWYEAMMLRAYAKYLRQARFTYSPETIAAALARHPSCARLLTDLFLLRFDPNFSGSDDERKKAQDQISGYLDQQLQEIDNLDDDIIIRRYRAVMMATMRTNYFLRDENGDRPDYLSFKIASQKVPELPQPRPFREIYVYSPRLEAVHLRGNKVARGGLRWSDRREDFRTEILGLMKAQMVKNAVIVPEGSKGGFVLKRPPVEGGREALVQEAIACYRMFLSGMLDITDNIVKGEIVPPEQVVRHDADDPYLVVAADKGTASFSDIANDVSESYGFWLGDAFASGGSYGYDHKEMGITARGAWVSVVRHFQEMGLDPDKDDFTVTGIGDMSGDVFGNGMLLSRHIKMIAAFDHRHIFIDPNPDPERSFKERERLFALERSSWADYDASCISKGGGVYPRTAKSISLSAEACKALGLENAKGNMQPSEVIRAILKAPVDLLWNGGIGTYAKAESESQEQVGDPANDALRVNGRELRCKMVGEGGNLGLTQLGRIEYAEHGGRINTDAIDNSAGVDCSDHEVNIKIAFKQAIEDGSLKLEKRNALLEEMEEEMAHLVLRDNRLQTQAISIAQYRGVDTLDAHVRLMRRLEREGMLDRKLEFLPGEDRLEQLRNEKRGLTRPEIAVLLAYSKLALYRDMVDSHLPELDYFKHDLKYYFPEAMREPFSEAIENHPLRREIVATAITNSMVNRVGSSFFNQMNEETGMPTCDIARAYAITRDVFRLRRIWQEIEDLDGKVMAEAQLRLFVDINHFVRRATLWFLRNKPQPLDIEKIAAEYMPAVEELRGHLEEILDEETAASFTQRREQYIEAGIPEALAQQVAAMERLTGALDIVHVAKAHTERPLLVAGRVYFALGGRFRLNWLREQASRLTIRSHWERLGMSSILQDLSDEQRRLTEEVIEASCSDDLCTDAVAAWAEKNAKPLSRYDQFIEDLLTNDVLDFAMLNVALRRVESVGRRS